MQSSLVVSIFFDSLSILRVQVLVYFFNLFFFEHLKFSPSLAFLFCLCTFIFISMLCLAKIYIYIFIIALMNYSYGDRQPFSSLLIV